MVHGWVAVDADDDELRWRVVVGERFIAAFDAASASPFDAAADAETIAHVDALEALIGRIPLGDDPATSSFAIVWWDNAHDAPTVVVRGEAAVDLGSTGGSRRFDARGITPWHFAQFTDVTTVRIVARGAPLDLADVALQPVVGGARSFLAAGVQWRAVAPDADADSHFDADTILRAPRDGSRAEAGGDAGADTIVRVSRSATRTPRVAGLVEEEEDAVVPRRVHLHAAVRIDGGEPRTLDRPMRIGRQPSGPVAGAEQWEPLRVSSTHDRVSSSHLELRRTGDLLIATDLRSTNGTVVRHGPTSRRMRSGESLVVTLGTIIELGGVTIVEILHDPTRRS